MSGTMPRSVTGRLPATPSRATQQGEAALDLQFCCAFERWTGRDHRVKLYGPQHWWRSRRLIQALCYHPEVGIGMVRALLPWLRGDESKQRAAQHAGISVDELSAWKTTCTRVVRKEFWGREHTANAARSTPGTPGNDANPGSAGTCASDDHLAH